MKNIVFNDIEIKNFLSVGDDPLILNFKKGINLITGENKDTGGKNGIGKSTISDALYWCLFGNTLRELKKENIQHNKNKKTCIVKLNLSIKKEKEEKTYSIERSLDPAKITIMCDNVDITPSTLAKSDELIRFLIGVNEEVFQNAIIMSTNNTLPFMAQKKVDKRKFIEGIFQLNIFSDILLKTRSEFNDVKKQNDILSNDFINQQKNLQIFEKQKQNGEENKNKKIKEFENKIEETKKEIEKLKQEKVDSVENVKKSIKEETNKIKILEKGKNQSQIKIDEFYKNKIKLMSFLEQINKEKQNLLNKENTCPVCNREFCKNDLVIIEQKITEIEKQIESTNVELENIIELEKNKTEEIQKINSGIQKIQKNIQKLNEDLIKSTTHHQKTNNLIEKIKEYEKYVKEIKNEKLDYDQNIEKCQKEITRIENELKNVKKTLQILNSAKFIVSEEGIKTFIVKKMIKILNQRLNFYLKRMGSPCICEFNEMFEETIYNHFGKECSYFNFSGGERKRIDVAILFMFQDILRLYSNTFLSVNMYDELFDSALDDNGINDILKILKEKVEKYEESVYIITHKNINQKAINDIIFLEKNNGVTKLIG